MFQLSIFFYFIFGTIIGSFLNVLTLRYNTGKGIYGRSSCPSCRKELRWFELVPIFSWVWQGGRCANCGSKISLQYPIVEFATGASFSFAFFLDIDILPLILFLSITSTLIAIAIYDVRHTIIPDSWVYFFAFLSFLFILMDSNVTVSFFKIFESVFAGALLSIPFVFLWFISKGMWIGLGDAKLIFGIGILLGIEQGFFSIMLSFVLGAIVGIFLLLLSSEAWARLLEKITPTKISQELTYGFRMRSEIPFGPFLIGVSFVVWVSNLHGMYVTPDFINEVLVLLS
ncbi:hypothetical protein COU13_01905 [Candidatus Kaiserbacteria bacterium CG10_big_fil_rev_8_21_14_0_10_43_70]|uniref:Prepilin peptidase n=1 Tax=Candidatus Kaiserbacteria bacterium CG10_big_fil_rev_8_21_14_0_10_43_70 TaxID=1974605 RepID=A0A2H0UKS7_9BACT|nr:MAG: hypothetical protein COU13_01905 [Candidatus Kaiserbacteria bacterium CG10_big_fil_rev_8_21_14_0_10_43_70]